MPHVELYINDKLLDLKGDESIEVDYAIFDINKIGSRGGARSYEFSLPKTNRNKSVLENPEMVNNLSAVPYTRLPCLILVDGVDVLIRFAEVASVKDAYNIRVYGSNTDLFATLKDLKCRDLDLSDYNHFWNRATIYASRVLTEGYIYPVIDWQADSPNFAVNNDNRVVRCDYMLPCLFYNTALERIFTEAGYTLVNEIEDDTSNVLIAHGNMTRDKDARRYTAIFSSNDTFPIHDVANGGATEIIFETIVSQELDFFQTPRTDSKFYFADDITMHVTVTLSITSIDAVGVYNDCIFSFNYTDRETVGGGGVGDELIYFSVGGGTDDYVIEFDITLKQALTDGYVYLDFFLTAPFGFNGVFTLNGGATIEFSEVVIDSGLTYIYNPPIENTFDYVTAPSILPDITQVDLVKNYLQMFCLIPYVNEITKTVTLKKFDSLLSKLYDSYQWEEKIDMAEPHEITYILDQYGQNNYFKYTQDGDEMKPVNADGRIIIDNGNLELEKDVVELDFAATNPVTRLVDNTINQIGVFVDGEFDDEREPRVLVLYLTDSTAIGGSMTYDDIPNGQLSFNDSIPFTYFIEEDNEFNLGFGDNLLENYYDLLTNILNNVKYVSVMVRLSAADISQLDFSRPVFIQKFESYFYISAVKGFSYTESKSTLVELVKLNING